MKVSELIIELQKQDPDKEVRIFAAGYTYPILVVAHIDFDNLVEVAGGWNSIEENEEEIAI